MVNFNIIRRWLCSGITFLEFLISWKFRTDAGNMLDNPWPMYIVIPWMSVCLLTGGGYLYLRFNKNRTMIYGDMTFDESPLKKELEDESSEIKENVKEKVKEKLKEKEKEKVNGKDKMKKNEKVKEVEKVNEKAKKKKIK